MKKICLFGASGQLGQEIQSLRNLHPNFEVVPFSSKDADICNKVEIQKLLNKEKFDIVINCAAYTAVDLAEKEMEKCQLVNDTAVKNLVELCSQNNIALIHISTDFVFDGTAKYPLIETDKTNPLQVYGKTKLAGEEWVKNNGIVVRTSWLYSSFGNNFVKTMMRLGRERDTLNVINNQFGTPTYAADLADAILKICSKNDLENNKGVYHYSNEGKASWFDFAKKIMEIAEIDCQVNPIPDSEYPTPAKRPKYSVMDKTKIKTTFNIEIPQWETSVIKCIEIIKNNENRN